MPSAGRFGLALEFEHLGLQRDHVEQLVEIGFCFGRDFDFQSVAAEQLDLDFMLQQFGAHALGLGVGFVDLVDGDDDRHLRRLGVLDGFDRLRHDAVVGRNHQHDDIGDLGAAGAHRRERGVAGRVDEGDAAARRRRHLIGADMLGDAAGFAGRDFGRADGVEQRRLAVIDVAHDGDDRRARLQVRRIVGRIEHAFFDVGFGDAAHGVAELLGDELGGIGVDRIGDLRHVTLLHQDADHVDGALGHAVGQFLDGDRFRERHFAGDLFLGLVVAVAAHALDAAAERGDRALAHLVGGKRGHDGEAAAALFAAAARRLRRRRRTRRHAAAAGARALRRRRPRAPGRAPGLAAVVVSVPKRFLATSSALRLVSSSCLRRTSSLSLRASAAARSARSVSSRPRRTRASSSARSRSSCSRNCAPASA